MSSAILVPTERAAQPSQAAGWATGLAALFVASMFYVADHDWRFSQLDLGQEVMESSTEEGNPWRRFGLVALGLAGAALLALRNGRTLHLRGALAWLCAAFLLWCAASALWAVDAPLVLRRLFAGACLVAVALAAAKWYSPRQVAWIALLCTGAYVLVGVAAELSLGLFRPWSGEYRFAGTMHPNDQGMHCAVWCLAAGYLARGARRGRAALVGAAAVAFAFLVLTRSRTSLGALVAAMIALQLLMASPRARIGWILAAVFVASWGLLLTDERLHRSLAEVLLLHREDSDPETLTGRTPLWEDLREYAQDRPLVGYGYSGFWTPRHISEVSASQGWAIAVGHSAYLDLLLGIGAVGMALGLLVLVVAVGQAARREHGLPGAGYGFLFAVLVLCACNGVLESNVLLPRFVPLVAMTGIALLALQDRPPETAENASQDGAGATAQAILPLEE